ncbi:MAG: hypothetical protein ABJM86_00455 [Hyphomicrobiales bacterium]
MKFEKGLSNNIEEALMTRSIGTLITFAAFTFVAAVVLGVM